LTLNVPVVENLAAPYLNAVVEADEAADFRTYIDPVTREEADSFWQLAEDELEAYFEPQICPHCQTPVAPGNGLWGFEGLHVRLLKEAGRNRDRFRLWLFDSQECQLRMFMQLMMQPKEAIK
jgi:hypothetical protein